MGIDKDDREGYGSAIVSDVLRIGMGANGSPRFVGEQNDPDGCGSHALIASWYDYCGNANAIGIHLARVLTTGAPNFFRLPNVVRAVATV